MTDEERLEELLDRWEENSSPGRRPTPEELCRDCPELLEALRERLQRLARVDDFVRKHVPSPLSPEAPLARRASEGDLLGPTDSGATTAPPESGDGVILRAERADTGTTTAPPEPGDRSAPPTEAGTLAPAPPPSAQTVSLPPPVSEPTEGALPHGPPSSAQTVSLAPPGSEGGTRTPPPMPWPGAAAAAPGRRVVMVPGYEVLGTLGEGGMGVVYKARQTALDRVVALKMILHAEHAGADTRERFRREAEAVARLQHPNIVQVFEVGEHDGLPYFSLEFCSGGSLDDQLDGTPWEAKKAAQMVETLARAMYAAHQAKVIHRDLKPGNVLLSAEGQPKITDFGLAKKLDEQGKTQTGAIMGTPSYMAPEQAKGLKDIGPAADTYALGAILYELLTGRPPFKGRKALDTVVQVVSEEPVPPRRLQSKCPVDIETITLKCLQKEPGRRYASAAELADDLRRFQQGEPVLARPVGLVRRGIKWCRRRPTAAALLGVSLLAFAAAGIGAPLELAHLRAVADRATAEATAANARAAAARALQQAQALLDRKGPKDLEEARVLLAQVRDDLAADAEADPQLAEYRATALRLLGELDQREKARENYLAVFHLRDKALEHLHRDVFTGTDTASPVQSREEARQALAPYGLPDDALREESLAALNPQEVQELRLGLYEVCLVLAEALVRQAAGQEPAERRRLANEALRAVERAAALAPDTRATHRRRARCLDLAGDAAAAARERAAAGQGRPATAVDWFFAGCDSAFVDGDWDEAIGHFDQALRQEPRMFWAHFFRATACQKQQAPGKAIASLTACVTERPDFVWTYLVRGSLYGQAGDFQAAADDFAAAERLKPDDSALYVLYVNRGFAALRRKEPRQAVLDLEKAIGLRPQLYHAHVNLAEAHLLLRNPARALVSLNKAIALEPKLAALYRTRARARLQMHDREAALPDLDAAIRLTPSGAGTARLLAGDHRERALALYHLRRYPQALLACTESLKLYDLNPVAHRLHGEILLRLDCFAEALAAFDRCLELGAERPGERPGADFFLQRARAREGLRDPASTIEEYTSALRESPEDAATHVLRGWAYLRNDFSTALALRDFEEALRLDPKQADAYLGRGAARARMGRYREAAADAEEAVRRNPESHKAAYNAARVYAQVLGGLDGAGPPGYLLSAETHARYRQRAVDCLRRWVALRPREEQASFWKERVEQDPAFRSLSRTREFARLAEEVPRRPR
jgi:tetratricopeptide (TPR) repeat protein/predicted Ser/Thr protein kinase